MRFRSPLAALALAALLTADNSPAQQLLNRSVDVQGVTREFLVYLPASYDGITDLPVMLVFHGGGMNPTEMLQLVD
ncbi:MAG: hypothetical protein MK209_08605, partial [Planctomycetes bacterium]|nr:hypothetical protein [Planctomycetota bacterium]